MLVPNLPPESALAVAQRMRRKTDPTLMDLVEEYTEGPRDPDTEAWSRAEQLLAAIIDQLSVLHWTYLSAHSEKNKAPRWKPEPTPRPGVAPKASKPALEPEQQALLARHLARTQGQDATYN